MSPVSEQCSCGARIDLIPGMPLSHALKFIDSWRTNHKHEAGSSNFMRAAPAMGFALPPMQDDD